MTVNGEHNARCKDDTSQRTCELVEVQLKARTRFDGLCGVPIETTTPVRSKQGGQ
jgi:hypothetical protein